MIDENKYDLSLLWKTGEDRYFELEEKVFNDLNLASFLALFNEGKRDDYKDYLKNVPTDPETIIYRQEVLSDFVEFPEMMETFNTVLDKCKYMTSLVKFAYEREASVYNLLKRVEESEQVMAMAEYLHLSLMKYNLKSQGLIRFRELLTELIESDIYQGYQEDMTSIKALDGKVRSIKIGMNFDKNLNPETAIVISLEEKPFHYTRAFKQTSRIVENGLNMVRKLPRRLFAPETIIPTDDLNTLEQLMEPALKQLIQFCDIFNQRILSFVEEVLLDGSFYYMLKSFHDHLLAHHVPVTLPKIGLSMHLGDFCNVNLLGQMMKEDNTKSMVYNTFSVKENERCFILTGANQGGKTTITQALGQVHVLAQLGSFIPAKQVTIKPIDGLYLLFPREEASATDYGRLGEECHRFAEIFGQLTKDSLFLMNETFAGTSHLESQVLAMESIRALAEVGCVVVYNTHLHELVTKLNERDDTHTYISLVTGSDAYHQSFTVQRREPLGKSYAREIAVKYGLSYEQLTRGV